jgi:hypothetical protein
VIGYVDWLKNWRLRLLSVTGTLIQPLFIRTHCSVLFVGMIANFNWVKICHARLLSTLINYDGGSELENRMTNLRTSFELMHVSRLILSNKKERKDCTQTINEAACYGAGQTDVFRCYSAAVPVRTGTVLLPTR